MNENIKKHPHSISFILPQEFEDVDSTKFTIFLEARSLTIWTKFLHQIATLRMGRSMQLVSLCSIVAFFLLIIIKISSINGDIFKNHDQVRKSGTEIIRLRGYLAEEHLLITPDGYILTLVRATNPLINEGRSGLPNKDPILFVHGSFSAASIFVLNGIGAQPKDYSHLDAGSMSQDELEDLLKDDPGAGALPLLAMNFGHEVWLLNKRGSEGSQRKIVRSGERVDVVDAGTFFPLTSSNTSGLTNSFQATNPISAFADAVKNVSTAAAKRAAANFWAFSLDEQIGIDFPMAVERVTNHTGRPKIAVVSHSAGGAITLAALAEKPELADKLSQVLFYAPSFVLLYSYAELGAPLSGFTGSFPPAGALNALLQYVLSALCDVALTRESFCFPLLYSIVGYDHQLDLSPDYVSNIVWSTSLRELFQASQSGLYKTLRKYDYGLIENLRRYGNAIPPIYDTSRVRAKNMTFFAGKTDGLSKVIDVEAQRSNLTVPSRLVILENDHSVWNHVTFFFSDQAKNLVIIPSLKIIES